MFPLNHPVFDRATPENLQEIRNEIDKALSTSQPPQIYVHPLAIEFVQQAYGADGVPDGVYLDGLNSSEWGIVATYASHDTVTEDGVTKVVPVNDAVAPTVYKPKKGNAKDNSPSTPGDPVPSTITVEPPLVMTSEGNLVLNVVQPSLDSLPDGTTIQNAAGSANEAPQTDAE